jgi:hypothetical protein
MATTYTWNILNVESTTADGVVFTVNYEVTATDGTYTTGAEESVNLSAPTEGSTIIPYSDLTSETVLNWVQERIGGAERIAEIESILQEDLDRQRTTQFGLPWVS